jgi:hypothetical protein
LSGCGNYKQASKGEDTSSATVISNGGFAVQTGDYLYFINGVENYTADNTFGDVVKGSIQRISKTDLNNHNYTNTQTIVPMIAYSGNYDAGLYIYGDYIYYSTPSTDKNTSGEVQNQLLEFRRSKLDGSETEKKYFYQASSNSIAYRYVQCDDVVYLVYALSETLYDSATTNIHSVNTATGVDTLLAYNVSDYLFDSEDVENPYIYYTMDVTNFLGSDNSITEGYNQLYRVKADATTSPWTYNFSNVDDYDADDNPLYINLGEYVLDGIGIIENASTTERLTQFNYSYQTNTKYDGVIDYHDYTYALTSYKNGTLLFTRAENIGDSPSTSLYSVTNAQINGAESWDPIKANNTANADSINLVLTVSDTTDFNFVTINGAEKVVYVGDDGIMVGEITGGKLQNEYIISDASSAEIVALRTEKTSETEEHLYVYYSGTKDDEEGYYRLAVDGNKTDYDRNKYPVTENATYKDTKLLDISLASSWYSLEFVDNQVIFASSTEGMSDYNYIMALDLSGTNGYIMSNKELAAYNDKYTAVTDKIAAYDDELNSDGSAAYENLSDALTYLFYTRDSGYLATLIKAYEEVQGQDEEYMYSKESAQIYLDFANAEGDWADYATDSKVINGEVIYANSHDYYYSVLGKITDDDKEAISDAYKSSYSMTEPTSDESWWDSLATWVKVIFIVGVSLGGLLLIGGGVLLTLWLVKRAKAKKGGNVDKKVKVKMDVSKEEYNYSEDETGATETDKGNTDKE